MTTNDNSVQGKDSALAALSAEIHQYRIPATDVFSQITIEERQQPFGKNSLWAVKKGNCVLNREGEWEYEMLPSSRDEEFIARCRFESAEGAAQALIDYMHAEVTKGINDH